ncbi:MAG: hypothetical protein ICV73_22255 [Acetobacteraceae bacterium]|nr:hypothetical protein [Acetobacteraceae bacterium]
MWNNDKASERRGGPRFFLEAVVAALGALVAAALFLCAFDGGLPKPAKAATASPFALAGGGGQSQPRMSRLCFHGPAGELLDLAPAGQHCR